MDISSSAKRYIFKTCVIVLSCSVLLWISLFNYGLLYYLYIPAVAHVKPVYLKYDTSCIKGNVCHHPHDNVTLVEKGNYELLSGGQSYAIEIVLDMPESQRNIDQGMFMIHLKMLSATGETLESSRRPTLLRYKSPLFKVIYTLFFIPGLLAGSFEEKQTLTISLFENYVEPNYHPAHYAYIEIEAQVAEIYSSSLRIHAQFTGLRYLMYYWPLLSAIVGVGMNFLLLLLIIALIYVRQATSDSLVTRHSSLDSQEQQKRKEDRKNLYKRYSSKFSELRGEKTPTSQKVIDKSRMKSETIENLPMYREKKQSPIAKEDLDQFEDAVLVPDESELSQSLRRKTEQIFGESSDTNQICELTSDEETSPVLRKRTVLEQCETEL